MAAEVDDGAIALFGTDGAVNGAVADRVGRALTDAAERDGPRNCSTMADFETNRLNSYLSIGT